VRYRHDPSNTEHRVKYFSPRGRRNCANAYDQILKHHRPPVVPMKKKKVHRMSKEEFIAQWQLDHAKKEAAASKEESN
jgi:hypothetical protein